MGKTVWMVEDGEYSDYHVVGIYSTKERADFVAKRVGGTVAEAEIDPGYDDLRGGRRPWIVTMLRDGSTERLEPYGVGAYGLGSSAWLWERSKAPAYKGTDTPDALQVTAWAKTEKGAIKIANEFRLQKIASGEWK